MPYIELPIVSGGGAPSGAAGGELTGTYPNPGVGIVNGVTMPIGGSLTIGQVLRATAAGIAAYGALNLANVSAVTGILPFANIGTVTSVNAVAMPAGGSLTTGTILRATGSGTAAYGALDLANTSAVTGALPFANLATITSVNAVAMPAGGSLTVGQSLRATASGTAAYGAVDLANSSAVTGLLPFANLATITAVNAVTMPAGGSLTVGQVLRATASGTAAYGAVDLSSSNAVTGTLGTGNLPLATSGAVGVMRLSGDLAGTGSTTTNPRVLSATASVAGKIQLAGDFGGSFTGPTVVGLTGTSGVVGGNLLSTISVGGTSAQPGGGAALNARSGNPVLSATHGTGTGSNGGNVLINTDTSDNMIVGSDTGVGSATGIQTVFYKSVLGHELQVNGDPVLTVGTGHIGVAHTFGATIPGTGLFRGTTGSFLVGYNTTDVELINLSGADLATFGSAATAGNNYNTKTANVHTFQVNSVDVAKVGLGGFNTFLSKAYPSDANLTLSASEYINTSLKMTGSISIQRNVVVPLTGNRRWSFRNSTTGGFAIQIIGASGTGIVIANAKCAIVESDGTNIVRVTADV